MVRAARKRIANRETCGHLGQPAAAVGWLLDAAMATASNARPQRVPLRMRSPVMAVPNARMAGPLLAAALPPFPLSARAGGLGGPRRALPQRPVKALAGEPGPPAHLAKIHDPMWDAHCARQPAKQPRPLLAISSEDVHTHAPHPNREILGAPPACVVQHHVRVTYLQL